MKRSLALSIAMLMAVIIAMTAINRWKLHGFERTSVPGLLTERHLVNLAPVDSKHIARGEIVLRNRGNEAIKIASVAADCSCTVIGGSGHEIKPGEVVRLLASVDVVPSLSGVFQKRAAISFLRHDAAPATELFYLRGEVHESPKVTLLTDRIDVGCIPPHGVKPAVFPFYIAGPRSVVQSLPTQVVVRRIGDVTVKSAQWSRAASEPSDCRTIKLVVDPEEMDAAEHFHFNVNIAIGGTEKELTLAVTGRISVLYADPSSIYITSGNEVKLRLLTSEAHRLLATNITSKGPISFRVLQSSSENALVVAIKENASPRSATAGTISYIDGSNRLLIPVLMLPAALSRDKIEAHRSH